MSDNHRISTFDDYLSVLSDDEHTNFDITFWDDGEIILDYWTEGQAGSETFNLSLEHWEKIEEIAQKQIKEIHEQG